jgi:hypothetical protein
LKSGRSRNTLENETRYSPAKCIGCDMKVVSGNPERQNLSMRMSIRRFTRLTNAFSKKVENHAAAVAIWFMYYNFCRVHSTLRVTPAMEAGISDHVWSIEEMCALLPKAPSAAKRMEKSLILKALGEKVSLGIMPRQILVTGSARDSSELFEFTIERFVAGGFTLSIKYSGDCHHNIRGAGVWPTVDKAKEIAAETAKRLLHGASVTWRDFGN